MNETDVVEEVVEDLAGEVRKNWGWIMFMGILLVALGAVGLYMSGLTTLVSVFYIGVMLLAGGVLILIDVFKAGGWKAKFWDVLIAIAYIAAGITMIANPGASAIWFTMFIAAFLLVSGAARIIAISMTNPSKRKNSGSVSFHVNCASHTNHLGPENVAIAEHLGRCFTCLGCRVAYLEGY